MVTVQKSVGLAGPFGIPRCAYVWQPWSVWMMAVSHVIQISLRAKRAWEGSLSGPGSDSDRGSRQTPTDATGEVQSILPADEPLTPGAIYVLISGLTGSVLTRTRSLPIRFLAPPLFALAAAPYFLPKTSHNIRSYLSRVEDAHMPELAASHDRLNAQVASTWNQVRGQVGGASETAKGWGERAARGVEDATGLKVASVQGEVMRRVDEAKAKAKEIREQGLPREGERLERVGVVVEQRPVAEIVAPVGAGAKKDVSAAPAAAVKEQPKTRLV